ncbi:hypothetical protein Tco_0656522 [Tanacetum coccineum]|uniref:Uncharacterized protein n=1 Tax=Tanacetum coccineum TaxID=301880 RepID=A0ABQ4X8Z6_9ASTR
MSYFSGAASGLHPYHFTYPERKLTMEEMLYKFIAEGKSKHNEMRAFICDFNTTNGILFKERNNSLIKLRFGVQQLLKVINNTPTIDCEVKGVTTRGGKTSTQDAQNNDTSVHTDEPHCKGLEKSIDQSDLEGCEPVECNIDNDSNEPKQHIMSINTPYLVVQETAEPIKVEREHIYSASANEIDEKKPELKDLPKHLEYAYLHGDKSFLIIISSELSDKEKISLLQVLEKQKGVIA